MLDNHTYTIIIPKVDLAITAFDAVRNGEIPIANTMSCGREENHDSCCDDETIDEVEADDVSLIDGMEGHEFEYFCADLLRKNGFVDVSVTRGSGDQGVDILATKDGIKYAVQCKNYATPLGNTPVQEVVAGKIFYKVRFELVDWLLQSKAFSALVVSPYDKRIVAEIIHRVNMDMKEKSQKLSFCWGEYTIKD